MKITRKQLSNVEANMSITGGLETISVEAENVGTFFLTRGDIMDAVKEYIVKYQKELIEDGRLEQ